MMHRESASITLSSRFHTTRWTMVVAACDPNEPSGREVEFELLKGFLIEAEESSYADLVGKLCLSRGAARVTVHRFRRRFRELIREELAETVTPDQFDEELRHLRRILSG